MEVPESQRRIDLAMVDPRLIDPRRELVRRSHLSDGEVDEVVPGDGRDVEVHLVVLWQQVGDEFVGGLVAREGRRLRLTRKGMLVANGILRVLIAPAVR